MANLAKSLDQHETQDIHVTVPSNALYSQCIILRNECTIYLSVKKIFSNII